MGQVVRRTPSSRGRRGPFDLCLPGAPLLRREPSPFPFRSGGSSRSLAVTPSYRLAAFLGRADKMPRIRFYNRRSRHEHPLKTPIPETARRAPWETRRRSTSRPLSAFGFRLASNGAGPPCGHPTSDGHTLDGVPAGFGPVDHLFFTRLAPCAARTFSRLPREGKHPGIVCPKHLCRLDPLTPLTSARIEIRTAPAPST